MQPSRNFDDLKFSSIHRRILLWGSGGPFLDGYVLVMIGVALEQLTPALKLDADWIGLLGAGTLAGLFVGTSLFGYISDKVGRRKMFLIDIIAIGVISVATMFVSSPVELLVMPESPRWLLRKGRVKECEEMMIKLFGEPVAFDEEQPQQTRFRDLFNRRHFPFVLFVAAIWTCQVIPM
ncbi:hypothetical protein ACUWFG_20055, partial [Escherichia coli]